MNRKSFLRNIGLSALAIPLRSLVSAASSQSGDNYIMGDFLFYSDSGATTGKVIFHKNTSGKWKMIRDYAHGDCHRTEIISK